MKQAKRWMVGMLLLVLLGLAALAGYLIRQQKVQQGRSEVWELKPMEMAAEAAETAATEPAEAETTTAESAATESTAEPEKESIAETTAGEIPEKDIVLLFAGDVYLSNHVLNAYQNAGGIHGVLDEKIRAEIDASDIFMVNQEFPFTDRGTAAEDKQYTFRLPPEKISIFQEMGIDIVTLANNHILDFGQVGLLDSCEVLDQTGIQYVGGGPDLERARKLETIQVGDRVIGFLGTSRVYMASSWAAGKDHPGVFSTYDPTLPLEAIAQAKEQCDYLVVYVHWGVERETTPKEYQVTMGHQYVDAGADLVIGSHPHVLQPIEYYKGKPIVYSLGNFMFGSSIPKTTLLKVELQGDGDWKQGVLETEDSPVRITEIPCTSSAGYTRVTE